MLETVSSYLRQEDCRFPHNQLFYNTSTVLRNIVRLALYLPGQDPALQGLFPTGSPVHCLPPALGAGLLHCLLLMLVPGPHDTLQALQSLQSPQPPSTAKKKQSDLCYLWVRFFKEIQDWILKSERIRKRILRFFTKQINPRSLGSWCIKGTEESTLKMDSSVPLTHHDPRDLGSICLIEKHKIRYRILSDLRIQSRMFL